MTKKIVSYDDAAGAGSRLPASVKTEIQSFADPAAATHGATSKATPVDADELPLSDSAATFGLKKLTWANIKAGLKTYFDSVTTTLTNKDLSSGTNTFPTFYKPGGGDVALSDGGTGATLTDPNADRMLFWDDSASTVTWLSPGTGLAITGTSLDSTGGSGAFTMTDNGDGTATFNSTGGVILTDNGDGTATLSA